MEQTRFHPGEHLQEELDELEVSPAVLAASLGIQEHALIAVLQGRERMSADLALRLGHFFQTSAQFWLNLQTSFDLEQATRLHGAEIEALPTLQAA